MTQPHPLTAQGRRIKAATKILIEKAGGQTYAAEVLGISQSKISEYASFHHPDRFMRADLVASLEAFVGEPIVTRELADQSGHDLHARDAAAPVADLPHAFAHAMKEMADVQVSAVNAMADGMADVGERAEMIKQAQEAISKLHDFIVAVRDRNA